MPPHLPVAGPPPSLQRPPVASCLACCADPSDAAVRHQRSPGACAPLAGLAGGPHAATQGERAVHAVLRMPCPPGCRPWRGGRRAALSSLVAPLPAARVQNSTIMTGVSFRRGQTAVWAFLYANPPRLACELGVECVLPAWAPYETCARGCWLLLQRHGSPVEGPRLRSDRPPAALRAPAVQLNGAGLLPGTKTAIPGGTLEFAQFQVSSGRRPAGACSCRPGKRCAACSAGVRRAQLHRTPTGSPCLPAPVARPPQWGANRRVTVEQGDLTLHITQAFAPGWRRYMHWLEVWVSLKACPQPPVSGVLGQTLPMCTYRGA